MKTHELKHTIQSLINDINLDIGDSEDLQTLLSFNLQEIDEALTAAMEDGVSEEFRKAVFEPNGDNDSIPFFTGGKRLPYKNGLLIDINGLESDGGIVTPISIAVYKDENAPKEAEIARVVVSYHQVVSRLLDKDSTDFPPNLERLVQATFHEADGNTVYTNAMDFPLWI